MEDEVVCVVAIVYHAKGTGFHCKEDGRAAYGGYFGPESKFNISGFVPTWQTLQTAELCAVREAIKCFQNTLMVRRKTIESLVIVTGLDGVYEGLTQNVWKWAEKRYKTTKGKAVVDATLFRDVHMAIVALEERKVNVAFADKVDFDIAEAERLAESRFERNFSRSSKKSSHEEEDEEASRAATSSRSAALACWLDEAGLDPDARALCKDANIEMPNKPADTSEAGSSSESKPKHPSKSDSVDLGLILGQLTSLRLDNNDNFSLLFGPEWEAGISRVLARQRAASKDRGGGWFNSEAKMSRDDTAPTFEKHNDGDEKGKSNQRIATSRSPHEPGSEQALVLRGVGKNAGLSNEEEEQAGENTNNCGGISTSELLVALGDLQKTYGGMT